MEALLPKCVASPRIACGEVVGSNAEIGISKTGAAERIERQTGKDSGTVFEHNVAGRSQIPPADRSLEYQ